MRGKLFLYLAVACFLALIVIFVADGYMGIYDAAYVTAGEREEVIETDYWLRYPPSETYRVTYYLSAEWGQRVFFRYEIDNRRFSTYSTTIKASLWQENEKLVDLFSEQKTIEPFTKAVAEWTLAPEELEQPAAGVPSQYTVKISHGEVERNIVVGYYYPEEPVYPQKVPPE